MDITYGPTGYLVCPHCQQENQEISKQSPPEYAYHRKHRPEYLAKQQRKFQELRRRTKLALACLSLVLVQAMPPIAPVPPAPPIIMNPIAPAPSLPPTYPPYPLPPVRR